MITRDIINIFTDILGNVLINAKYCIHEDN